MKRKRGTQLSEQIKERSKKSIPSENKLYEGSDLIVSTGSTLLDLAISGERFSEGGIPFGILVEIFGPSSCGKTVLLCEIAGKVQKQLREVTFHDPEARLNKQFAKLFGLDIDSLNYTIPNTIPEVFNQIRNLDSKTKEPQGIFCDSLAALSTDLEMTGEKGDKMGMRRAKEFSEELRKTCRIISQKNYLMVCSNQVRQNIDAGTYGQKYISPGGNAIGFYSSLRLRCSSPQKVKPKKIVKGKETKYVIGVRTIIEIYKSSVGKPYRTAPLMILYDYGIDDIRENLQYIKDHTENTIYTIDNERLDISIEESIQSIEEGNLQTKLKKEVIALWNDIEQAFKPRRAPK